jgi:thioredoxin 1
MQRSGNGDGTPAPPPSGLAEWSVAEATARDGLLRVIGFYMPMCNLCVVQRDELERLAEETRDARVGEVCLSAHPEAMGRFGVRYVPTVVVARDGAELARFEEVVSAEALGRRLAAVSGRPGKREERA